MENTIQQPSSEQSSQSVQQSAVPPSTPAKSKLSLFIITAFVFLVVIGGGGYYFVKSSNLKSQNANLQLKSQNLTPTQTTIISPTPTVSETANWKTYTNEKYGFSFQYPSSLYPRKDSTPEFVGFLQQPDENQSQKVSVFIIENPNNLNLKEFLEKNKPIPDDRKNLNYQNIEISGYDALILRYEIPCLGLCENVKISKYLTKYIKGKRYIVAFSIDTQNQAGNTSDDENFLDQILSTFKFTN